MAISDLFPASDISAKFPTSNPLTLIPNARGYLDTLTNKFILKPVNAKGIGGFVFSYEGETTVQLQAEISDHYSEQNTFRNDHAAQKPAKIVLRGYIGELAVNPSNGILGALATLQGKLTQLPSLLGKYTPAVVPKIAALTTNATNFVNRVDSTIGRAQNLVGLFVNSQVAKTNQEKGYQQLYGMFSSNQVFTLTTPFSYFRSVMIESFTFTQDETTKQWSEVSVTVKEVRFLTPRIKRDPNVAQVVNPSTASFANSAISPDFASQIADGRAAKQIESPVNNGKVQGLNANVLLLGSGF